MATLGVGAREGTWRGADPKVEDVGRQEGAGGGSGRGLEAKGT